MASERDRPECFGGPAAPVRVVLMAPDPEATGRRRSLSAIIGGDGVEASEVPGRVETVEQSGRVEALEALLARRARTWALIAARARGQGSSQGRVSEASVSSPAELDPELFAGGPVLLAWPELPVWSARIGAEALDDLAAGCALSVGPLFDGGVYLLALSRPLPELVCDRERPWRAADAAVHVFEVAERNGLEVGMLRGEAGLRSADDVRALLADPLTDQELRTLLR